MCAGISLKKLRKIAKEWDKNKWAEFVCWMSQYSPEEIGYGHARKGVCAQRKGVFVQECCLSVVGLLTLDGMFACYVIEGSFIAEKFVNFLKHDVIGSLHPPNVTNTVC